MPSFLALLARDLMSRHRGNFKEVTVVFPNKRAGLFLAEELSRLVDRPIWMPEIVTLNEFIERYTGLKKADPVSLIIKLYKVYKACSGTEEKFEDFYFWGNMLLEDFDDLDKYLADAKDLFSNLAAYKKLDYGFSYLSEEQVEVIHSFWSSFNPQNLSNEQSEFLRVWDNLWPVYSRFREELFRKQLCYEGMGIRRFYEQIETFELPGNLVFAGFNALNACEKQIFTYCRNNHKARFYWDYDLYYTANEAHEAGRFIRENLTLFPNELDAGNFNNFKHNGKQIELISVPASAGQAKLLPELLQAFSEPESVRSAVVLCDEGMLIPVIHSLPESIQKVNVTMGYPARNSSVSALVSLLGELPAYTKTSGGAAYFYYKPVIPLLNHPLIRASAPEEIDRIIRTVQEKNIVYIPAETLHFNELGRVVFSGTPGGTAEYLLQVLSLLLQGTETADEGLQSLEKECIFAFYTAIQTLKNTFEEEGMEPDNPFYLRIIGKILNTLSIPFSGEPLEGLQIMGLQETRMLDFKNVVILSANEGILPKSSFASSFIPYNLRKGFSLPVPEHQDALFAYYFYRLLQRAENIRILFNNQSQGLNSGEMSRFLYQIKYESGLPVREYSLQHTISAGEPLPIRIEKSPEVLQRLSAYLATGDKILSPSALNACIDCPLRFYFRYVAGIREKEEVAEELDHRLLGNIFHESARALYLPFIGGEITTEVIDRILLDKTGTEQAIRKAYHGMYDAPTVRLLENGSNELVLDVIRKYLDRMFRYDKQFAPFRILSMEERYQTGISINTPEGRKTVSIGGVIDRIDRIGGTTRILDYKTGADTTAFKDIPALFDPENKTRNKAALQTLLYCLIYTRKHPGEVLIPGIYNAKLLFEREYDYRLQQEKVPVSDFAPYREELSGHLVTLLEELFDPARPFLQTGNPDKCRNCPYAGICNR